MLFALKILYKIDFAITYRPGEFIRLISKTNIKTYASICSDYHLSLNDTGEKLFGCPGDK